MQTELTAPPQYIFGGISPFVLAEVVQFGFEQTGCDLSAE
jgi:hypothetical protein